LSLSGRVLQVIRSAVRKFTPEKISASSELAKSVHRSSEGAWREAIDHGTRAVTLAPDFAGAWLHLGNLYSCVGDRRSALKAYETVLSLKLNSAAELVALGSALSTLGRDKDAAKVLAQVRSRWPMHQPAWLQSVENLIRMGCHEEALKVGSSALERWPDWPELTLLRGHALLLSAKERKEHSSPSTSRTEWRKALHWRPMLFRKLFDDAVPLWVNGLHDEALAMCEEGLIAQEGLISKLPDGPRVNLVLSSFSPGIGHLGLLDMCVKRSVLGQKDNLKPALLKPDSGFVNQAYVNHWKGHVTVVEDDDACARLRRMLPQVEHSVHQAIMFNGRARWWYQVMPQIERCWVESGRAPLLTLSDAQLSRGRDALNRMGIPSDAWFVALHVREPGYRAEDVTVEQENNADINTYRPSLERIADHGGWVIRMGDTTMKHFDGRNVIDYAHSEFKSDWMDVFLCGACRFFLGTTSGLSMIPHSFGVPIVSTNVWPMMCRPLSDRDLFIFKPYLSIESEAILSLAEVTERRLDLIHNWERLRLQGVVARPNTADEITDVVMEMLTMTVAEDAMSPSRSRAQLDYNARCFGRGQGYGVAGFIGTRFIERHADQLYRAWR
jgi:putative glycosyltransferase (TIGR04372 family)